MASTYTDSAEMEDTFQPRGHLQLREREEKKGMKR